MLAFVVWFIKRLSNRNCVEVYTTDVFEMAKARSAITKAEM
jgi:hypothetical protein